MVSPSSFDFDWQTRGYIALKGKCWMPGTDTPKGILALIHGFGEHIGRYGHVARFFNEKDYIFIGFDQYGHGKSGGKRGYVPDYHLLMENIGEFLSLIEQKLPQAPVTLYGHSMGGNLSLNFLLRFKPELVQKAIITSPWLRLTKEPSDFKVFAGRLISAIYPQFTDKAALNVNDLSRDPEVGKAYAPDPLVHGNMGAGLFLGVSNAGHEAIKNAGMIPCPTLLMHGEADPITSFPASKEFAERAGKQLTFRPFPGARHELHNETNKAEVLTAMFDWLEEKPLKQ